LFSIVGSLENKDSFGEASKLFEAIDESELHKKMEETFSKMKDFFDASGNDLNDDYVNAPNLNNINEHINEIMGGKIGSLAKEIAEETALDLNMDLDNNTNMSDLFKNLMKNPKKFADIIKNVENKISEKISSGELKQSELFEEASELMQKIGMEKILSNLTGGKVNMNAMNSELNKQMKLEKTKERLREKLEKSKQEKMNTKNSTPSLPKYSEEELIQCFSIGEKPEKTQRKKHKGKQ
jgi:hypothetical protein